MKILFADDSGDTRFLYQLGFQIAGHQVHLASDGFEAIEAVREHDFDIIVMDLEMPRLSGWDAIQAIRQMEKGRDLLIVILSAYYATKFVDQVRLDSVDMVLSKPILPEQLTLLLEGLYARKAEKDSDESTDENSPRRLKRQT